MIEQDIYGIPAEPISPEKENIEKVLESIPVQDRVNIVLQSFMVGAGSIAAHDMYVYYLSKQFSLTPREASFLLRKCFTSLSQDEKWPIMKEAFQSHPERMIKETKHKRALTERLLGVLIGAPEAASKSIESQFPIIIGNQAFDDVMPDDRAVIDALPRDFTPEINAPVVVALRKISDALGYYNDKEWKKKQVQEQQQET